MDRLRLLGVTLLVAACSSSQAMPSPSVPPTTAGSGGPQTTTPHGAPETARPRPTATPGPIATAAPFQSGPAWAPFGAPIEYEAGRTSASTAAHGIRVTLTADASSFSSSEGLWVTTRLENRDRDVLHWLTDGCEINIGVEASTGVEWAYGAEQPPTFRVFKDWLLERYPGSERYAIHLPALPSWALDKDQFGCADIGLGHDLQPGGRLTARHFVKATTGTWSGTYGLPPAGPVLITGTFGLWWRGSEDIDTARHEALVARLVVQLEDGRDPALISPGQAIDVALQSPVLQDLVRRYPKVADFAPLELTFDVTAARWTIHSLFGSRTEQPTSLTIVIDARTAQVVDLQTITAPAPARPTSSFGW